LSDSIHEDRKHEPKPLHHQKLKPNKIDRIEMRSQTLHTIHKKKLWCVLFKLDFEKAFDRVNWDFILEIMQGRKFEDKCLTWIKNIIYSSRTCININGVLGEYFSCKRGVR
jgi:Reverse transcriptase (RNA-dependent DNA polymerase)